MGVSLTTVHTRRALLSPPPALLQAEAQSKAEFQSKYGMKKKPPGFAQKKLSTVSALILQPVVQ